MCGAIISGKRTRIRTLVPSPTLSPALAAVFAAFAACLLTPRVRLVQVHTLPNFEAALRDFYFTYENDPRGSGYLGLELRVWVCGARGAEVVVGSGVVATAISS